MALFHHSTQVIGRSAGRSCVAAAAYRLGVELVDQRTGIVHDYTRKGGVESWHTLAPADAPAWVHDPAQLWNMVEATEKRKDAQLCREVNIALPCELTPEQAKGLALDYVREQWVGRGMAATVAFHDLAGDNPHMHALLTMRELTPEGFGPKVREWNDRELATHYREAWARDVNRSLEKHGHDARVDHRSLEAQGIEREPQQHMGPTAAAMEKRGAEHDRTRVRVPMPQTMDHAHALAEVKREQAKALEEAKAKAATAEATAREKRTAHACAQEEHGALGDLVRKAAGTEKSTRETVERRTKREATLMAGVKAWREDHPLRARLWGEPKLIREWRAQARETAQAVERAKAEAKTAQACADRVRGLAAVKAQEVHRRGWKADRAEKVAQSMADEVKRLQRLSGAVPTPQPRRPVALTRPMEELGPPDPQPAHRHRRGLGLSM